jgi:hypothetical protein
MLDSLKIRLESKVSEIRKTLNDSIVVLNKENFALKTSLEILKAEFVNRTYVIKDLQQLKDLLDDQIITQEEFNAKKARLLEKL